MICFDATALVPATRILAVADAFLMAAVVFMAACYAGDAVRWWRS